MLFSSQIFLFLFLPIVLIVYYVLQRIGASTPAKVALILASLVFYGYNHVMYLIILVGSILGNYLIYVVLRKNHNERLRFAVAAFGVVADIAVIGYFKYYDFFVTNCNRFFGTDWVTKNILLPLGISFFTIQQISFVIDAYRYETGEYNFVDYALFVSFFPQLIAGPIVLHDQLIPQFKDRTRWIFNRDRFADGIRYFVIGLFKKTMIADRFGRVVDLGYGGTLALDSPSSVFVIVGYTLQIYFDFSGYSDMAMGLAKMLGFDLPVNFNSPYKAASISEFWRRWHMTMTGFFTKYVYYPLGGSRKGRIRTYINIIVVFLVSGLWHGASWNFVEWGLFHGVAQCFYRLNKKWLDKIPKEITTFVTFITVCIGFILFRTGGLYQTKQILITAFTGGIGDSLLPLCNEFAGGNLSLLLKNIPVVSSFMTIFTYILTLLGVAATLAVTFLAPSSHEIVDKKDVGVKEGILFAFMALLSIMTFMSVSTFLYFNF